ncbi:hypothetical protein B0J13DRAFT_628896 [Dactylonectria estremocensis]|uniref:DUF6594 domain-containing protein n=1 Tax=Dactylonectria estremocensis TaxID=1079267 RepID=A0A9P9IIF8_9HYPO|nr:hypothetical protein B0J13DRAFT_628896 [Dactylonectria estremocensis]
MTSPAYKKGRNYHRLVGLIGKGKDLAIFRRFDELNMMTLLSTQAEILHLESQYNRQCDQDSRSSNQSEAEYSTYFRSLHQSRDSGGEQARLLDALQIKLGVYMLQLSKAESPNKSQLAELQGWMRDSKGGKNFLDGVEIETWTDSDETKYVTINPPLPENDAFTSLLRGFLLNIFHFLCGERLKVGRVIDQESGLVRYNDSHINKASSMMVVILSSVIPVSTIFALSAFKTTRARIGMIVAFTGLFAAVLAIFSTAKRAEIFAATATFAAIEVVYVGTGLSSNN